MSKDPDIQRSLTNILNFLHYLPNSKSQTLIMGALVDHRFPSSPGVIRVLDIIPFLGSRINIIAGIWMLVAMVIALRQALDCKSTRRAVGVCLIGWLIQLIIILPYSFFSVGVGSLNEGTWMEQRRDVPRRTLTNDSKTKNMWE